MCNHFFSFQYKTTKPEVKMQTMRAELLRKNRSEKTGIRSEKLFLHKDFIEKRKQQLDQIALLCKIYHKKVKISFQTSSGEQFVETSLWMSTGQYIILNDGRFIPVNAIIDVSF